MNDPTPMPAEALRFEVLGLPLQAQAWGPADRLPCLAVHGWLDNSNSFAPLVPHLPGVRLVAMDLPGHGGSAHRAADAGYHVVDWVRDVMGVADALGWSEFALMGHSMGGAIGCLTAGTFPERIRRLVLLDAMGPYSAPPETLPERLVAHLRQQARRSRRQAKPQPSCAAAAALMARVVPHLSLHNAMLLAERGTQPVPGGVRWSYDPRLKDTSVMTLTEPQVGAFLRRIACPTLLVRAAAGIPIEPAQLAERAALVPGLQRLDVPGGHHVHMESPERIGPAIAAFLA